jgi:tetratricopeptide (TPR) repeat protein
VRAVGTLLLVLATAAPALAQGMAARLAARGGRYDTALSGFARAAEEAPGDVRLHRAWIRTLLELGRHAEAERVIGSFAPGPEPELMTLLGELQAATGRLDEAAASFDAAIDGGASDALVAVAGRGLLRERRGDWEGAEADYESLIDAYNLRSQLSAEELVAVGLACRPLGPTNLQL